ncbi:MAG: site-specific recombinase, partial [Patescibacteria group bacterium]|nr:site-specific recombinase [Patescibacteria group bacterium]
VNKTEFDKNLTSLVSRLMYKDDGFSKTFEAVLMNKFREKEKELGEFSVQVGKTVIELEMEKKNLIESYTSTKNEIIREELEKKINNVHEEIKKTREQRNGIEVQENDIHAFVGYVKYLMEHPVEMLVKQKDLNALRGLFSVVFDELPTYEEIVNGTPKLSLPYKLSEEFKVNKDLCVTLQRIELWFSH